MAATRMTRRKSNEFFILKAYLHANYEFCRKFSKKIYLFTALKHRILMFGNIDLSSYLLMISRRFFIDY